MRGSIEEILIASVGGAAMISVREAHAVPGRGLAGDRYFSNIGTWSHFHDQSGKDLTLVEAEVLDDVGLTGFEARRNVVTRGVRLNRLVGHRFRVGHVFCAGVRLCEPCTHLRDHSEVSVEDLIHRGGLRAEILSIGEIAVGDQIEIEAASHQIGTVTSPQTRRDL